MDTVLVGGVLLSRPELQRVQANWTTGGSPGDAASELGAIRTASYVGTPRPFTSTASIATLMELNYLLVGPRVKDSLSVYRRRQ
jgi:hypothetical protein